MLHIEAIFSLFKFKRVIAKVGSSRRDLKKKMLNTRAEKINIQEYIEFLWRRVLLLCKNPVSGKRQQRMKV